MIAAWISRVEIRIYTINGLVWVNQRGWRRRILQTAERLSCLLATDVIAVSNSLRSFVIQNGVCKPGKMRVLGCGGSHGVDVDRFNSGRAGVRGAALRRDFEIPENALVLLFVGRIVREKGIEELAEAWRALRSRSPEAYLLLCGDVEDRDPVGADILEELRKCPRVRFGRAAPSEIQAYYAASDLCVLPTWREGLPNVALEAAAMGRAIVATRVIGCVDAIRDGETGILVEPRDSKDLLRGLTLLIEDEALRRKLGENARMFVEQNFSESSVSMRLATEYRRLLNGRGGTAGMQGL